MVPPMAKRIERGVRPGFHSAYELEFLESVACDPPRLVANRSRYIIARCSALNLMYFESHCIGVGPVYVMVGCGRKSAGREPMPGGGHGRRGHDCQRRAVMHPRQPPLSSSWRCRRALGERRGPRSCCACLQGASKSTGKRALHSWGVVGF